MHRSPKSPLTAGFLKGISCTFLASRSDFVAEWLQILLRSRDVPSSNLGLEIYYVQWGFRNLSQSHHIQFSIVHSNRPRPLPSTPFSLHDWQIILPLDITPLMQLRKNRQTCFQDIYRCLRQVVSTSTYFISQISCRMNMKCALSRSQYEFGDIHYYFL
jgi:hypothetical protein